MSIIENLIRPLKAYFYIVDGDYYDPLEVQEVEQQRNELLEAMIRNLELNQRGYFMKEKILKDIIEKIAGIPWVEIKELL